MNMTDTRICRCSFQLVLQIINSVILLLVLVVQGSILDYYLIQHNDGTSGWYFWFLADLLVLISFMASVVISYRYYKKKAWLKNAGKLPATEENKAKVSSAGTLPLSYAIWLFYVTLLVVKIILLFKMNIAQNLDENSTFGPQLLKVVIGMSSVVFFLLVESHHDAEPQASRLSYMHLLITSTAFELFDSITFLSILFPIESQIVLPYSLEDAILALACANFFLPGLALFKLSRSDFGSRPRSIFLSLIYKALHLLLINVPYLVIRIYLWSNFARDISLFLMKNIMAVVVLILTSIPDIQLQLSLMHERQTKRKYETNAVELSILAAKEAAADPSEKKKMILAKEEKMHTRM